MPIDPRIALGVRPGPAPIMPSELEQRRLTLADLGRREKLDQQQAEMNDMRLAEGRQKQAEYDAAVQRAGQVRGVLEKHGGDIEKALPELWSLDPGAADKFESHVFDRKKRDFESRKLELEQATARAKRLGEIAQTATDQATLRRAVEMAVAEKLLTPEMAAQIGDAWDDNSKAAVSQFRNQALSVEKQLEEARKAEEHKWNSEEEGRRAAKAKRDEELHKATLPSKTADPKTGLTPAQAATVETQRGRTGEQSRHNRAMEAKGDRAGDDAGKQAQREVNRLNIEARGLQGRIDTMEKSKGKLRGVKTQLESEIATLEKDKPDNWEKNVAAKRVKWAGNEAQLREIEGQQAELVTRKDGLYGQIRGVKGGGERKAEAAPAQSAPVAPRKKYINDKTGEIVEWDGKQWVKVQ